MKMKGNIRKLTSFLLVFLMVMGVFVPTQSAMAESKELQVKITDFNVANADGTVPADSFIANQIFRLKYNWEASDNGNPLKEGDYFELELPDKFKFPLEAQYSNFEVKAANGDVVANAVITPQEPGGGKIRVTFTSYVNDKLNVPGEMYLTARWNQTTYPITGPVDHDIVVGSITRKIHLKPYMPPNYASEVLYKTAGGTLTGEGWVRWRIRVNAKQGNLTNVVIKDNLWAEAPGNPDGIEYVTGQFMLYELSWNAGKNEFDEINPQNVSNQINISPDKRSFTYNMGNMNGKGYILHYRTNYKQGLLLKNRVELTSDEIQNLKKYGEFLDAQAGGGVNDDFNSRIKIIKFDGFDKTKLKGAKFKITKKGTGDSIYVETDVNGEALTMPIMPGEYTIKETEAPQHYIKDDQEYTVTVSSDKLTRINIGNAPETVDIKVRKEWIGFEQPSIKAVLYADGAKVAEQELKAPSWEYIFKNLRKYNKNTGAEIIYTVNEEVVPTGYECSITGSTKDGFLITNKQKTIDIKGEKTWDDNNNAENKRPQSITIVLYANGNQIQNPEVKPDANGKWLYSFEGLQAYDNQGNEIAYTIKEEPVPGYTSEVKGYDIINHIVQPETRIITVTKVWQNSSGNNIEAPVDSIEVELFRDGVTTGKKINILKDNGWSGAFESLDKTDNTGKEYKYTVKEVGETNGSILIANKWFGVTYEGNMEDGYKVINKEKPTWSPYIPGGDNTPKPGDDNNQKPGDDNNQKPGDDNNQKPGDDSNQTPGGKKPSTPGDDKPSVPGKHVPITGDKANLSLYAGLLLMSGSLLLRITQKGKKKEK